MLSLLLISYNPKLERINMFCVPSQIAVAHTSPRKVTFGIRVCMLITVHLAHFSRKFEAVLVGLYVIMFQTCENIPGAQ